MELEERVAIITGAGQGIGEQIALKLAENGANIVAVDINIEGAKRVAAEITSSGGRAIAIKTNVVNSMDVEAMVEESIKEFAHVDILVNNAGITRDALLIRLNEEDWDKVLGVNLKGVYNCTKAAVKYMSKSRYGRIVNVASIVGEIGNVGQANYAASKAGVIGFTKTVAREFAGRNITCNAIAPGFIETEMTQKLNHRVRELLLGQIPMGRFGTPEDVALSVLFLVSEASAYVTGQVLNVNGGMYM